MHLSALVVVAAGLAQAGIANGFTPPSLGFPNHLRRDDSVQAVITIPGLPPVPSGRVPLVSTLPLNNIQADILVGMTKAQEFFYFFTIKDPKNFKAALRKTVIPMITSVTQVVQRNSQPCEVIVNVGFSASGLRTLNISADDLSDPAFSVGQFNDASNLGDPNPSQNWIKAFQGTNIHGVFLVASTSDQVISTNVASITKALGSSVNEAYGLWGAIRNGTAGSETGHEHFGFKDGIANPFVAGYGTQLPGQSLVAPGVLLTGQSGDAVTRASWTQNGSFLAFRQLKQLVPEFNKFLLDNPVSNSSELMGARMMGRWKSGAPIDLSPTHDDIALGNDIMRNQNFDYNHTNVPGFNLSSDQTFCPFTAHTRKTRPRADLGNLETFQILRAGIPYGPDVTPAEAAANKTSVDRGLAFVSYQANIGKGFRFLQVNWTDNAAFPPAKSVKQPGLDPIIGQNIGSTSQARAVTGLDPSNPQKSFSIQPFIQPVGGEYFFSPSISALSDTIAKA